MAYLGEGPVFCSECRHFIEGPIRNNCGFPENVVEQKINTWRILVVKRKYKRRPHVLNRGNICVWYSRGVPTTPGGATWGGIR